MAKIQQQNEVLKKQLEDIQKEKQMQLEKVKAEDQNFREMCQKLLLDEKQKQQQQKEINLRIAEEVKLFNQYQQIQKEEKKKQQMDEDRKLLDAQLERERMLTELEEQQKEKYKRETREFLKQFQKRTDQLKIKEQLIDQLINEQIEMQWKKRQEVWKKEEKARIALLKDVYAHRYDAIEGKKKQREAERKEKEHEKALAKDRLEEFNAEERQYFVDELKKMSNYRDLINRQVTEKIKFHQQQKFTEMEEDRKRHLQELEYQQAVEEETRKGLAMIDEMKKYGAKQ